MRTQTEQVAYLTDDAIEINARILPFSVHQFAGELAVMLNEKFADAPHNRATRRQVEREVTNWIQRRQSAGFVHIDADGNLELVPEDFPEPLREYLGDVVELINTKYAEAADSPIVLRRMSKDIVDWINSKTPADL